MTRKPSNILSTVELAKKNSADARDNLHRTMATLVLVQSRHRELLAMR